LGQRVNYFYEQNHEWLITAYEKQGFNYKEIAVMFEGPLMPVEAFEMMNQFCNAVPMWQAVQHALEVEGSEPEAATPSYEVRLINKESKRVVVTIMWESESVNICKADFKARKVKTHSLYAEIDLAEDEDVEEVNLSALAAAGAFRVIDIYPVDEVKLEDTNREEQ